MTSIDFSQELIALQQELHDTTQQLVELRGMRDILSVNTQTLDALMAELLQLEQGHMPSKSKPSGPVKVRRIAPTESGKTKRRQLKVICRALGAEGEVFGTADIYRQFERKGDEVTPSLRSYVSAMMRDLAKEESVIKVSRGKWTLA